MITYNLDGQVRINNEYEDSFENFNTLCEETGYKNPFKKGNPVIYKKGEGQFDINPEGHVSKPDGKDHPEYDIFIEHLENIKTINVKKINRKEQEIRNNLPNLQKRRLTISYGGYGTAEEQLDILAKDGIVGFQKHRADIDAKFPVGE